MNFGKFYRAIMATLVSQFSWDDPIAFCGDIQQNPNGEMMQILYEQFLKWQEASFPPEAITETAQKLHDYLITSWEIR
jgi:hypothetical protein